MTAPPAQIAARLRRCDADNFLAIFAVVPPLGILTLSIGEGEWPLTAGVLISVATVPLRHRSLMLALAVAMVVALIWPTDRPLVMPVLFMIYQLAKRESWRRALAISVVIAAALVLAAVLWGHQAQDDHGGPWGYPVAIVALVAAAAAAGLYIGAHSRMVEALRERAEKLQREQELLAERSVAQERMRIAHEIHDVVAHNVSLMVLKAQVLGVESADPAVREATDELADLGRHAISEMHATVRLMRADEAAAPLAPQPGLAQLDQLITQGRQAGMQVQLSVEGPHQQLPQAVDLCAYRIIQEALTNVRKHEPDARTKVWLRYRSLELEIDVTDHRIVSDSNGSSGPSEPAANGSSGHGLIGMRERAELFGGTLTTMMLTDGFKVTAVLPYRTDVP